MCREQARAGWTHRAVAVGDDPGGLTPVDSRQVAGEEVVLGRAHRNRLLC